MDEKGKLGKKPMTRAIDTLRVFKDMIQLNPIKSVLPIATSAVREARNRDEFLNNICKETGFDFKVLSEREEAVYSYVGAIKSLHIPDVLFFDIGGGSLEIVYAEEFKIKKVLSLPLGALRLTQQFGEKISNKNYTNLKRHIWNLLPSKKDLGLKKDMLLVGVGGALRALARYEQKMTRYPLDKIHNYKVSRKSLDSTVKELSKMRPESLSEISIIGSSRAETIVAGSCVIKTLMQKYDFTDLYVSNHGLREGVLSVYLEDPKMYQNGNISAGLIEKIIDFDQQNKMNPEKEKFVDSLVSSKLITNREQKIIGYAEKKISEKSSFSNPQSIFYSILDEDMPLTHTDQLILGLSLVHARHPKTFEWLFTRYKSILSQQDKVSMKKISTLINLMTILDRTKSRVELKQHGQRILELSTLQSKNTHKFLLQNALKKFEFAFDVKIILSTQTYQGDSQKSMLES